jgi:hypothetical protein
VIDGSRPADEVHAALVAAVQRLLVARGWTTGGPAADPPAAFRA